MPKKVEKWEAEVPFGGFYNTKEEAEEAEFRHNFMTGFKDLEHGRVVGQSLKQRYGIGSANYTENCARFCLDNKEFIQKLFKGEQLELKPEPVKEEKKSK